MEFAIPGPNMGHPPSSQTGGAQDDSNDDNVMKEPQQNLGRAAVSVSSSGHSGNLSQASSSSGAIHAAPANSNVLPSTTGASFQQQQPIMNGQQQQQAPVPTMYNPLQISGITAALGPSFAMGNLNNNSSDTAAAATIGVPLSGPGFPTSTTVGQKRKSETDLSQASKEQRTADDSEMCSLSGKGPTVKDETELEKMTPAERRRYERNLREQQRSYRISQQIKQLRDVLEESKIPFKPNKFSILVSVVEYIKQLQTRAIMLDAEHQKLIDTIRQTNEMVSTGQVPSSVESSTDSTSADAITSGETDTSELSLAAAKELDFQVVFQCCPSGMAVCSLDGRILGCNKSFETSLGVKKEEVIQQSMFIYIRNHQDIFEAMADLLKRSSVASEAGEGTVRASHLLFWCGHVMSLHNRRSALTITLSSTADGNPKYFTLTVGELF